MKDTLMAAKNPTVMIKMGDLSPGAARLRTLGYTAVRLERKCERFGTDDSEIARFVNTLRKQALLG